MRLSEYLRKKGLTQTEFGVRIGKTAATVSRLAAGKLKPDFDTLWNIWCETDGKVGLSDFAADIKEARA
jgi:predicted transcriptional regulator